MTFGIALRPGNLPNHPCDHIVSVLVDGKAWRSPRYEELEPLIIQMGGEPNIWSLIEWAQGELPTPDPVYSCQDAKHALSTAFAMMAALESEDPRYSPGLHGFTYKRLRRVMEAA